MRQDRRLLLARLLSLPPAAWLGRTAFAAADGAAPLLPLTPACGSDEPTPRQTAGPYYRAGAPSTANLRATVKRGQPITLAGHVVDRRCRPLAGTVVEIWHADDAGAYDNRGFRLRAQQRTGEDGRWSFETIVTRRYAGRTAHYHFRLTPAGGAPLVTQLYFPDEPGNGDDPLFDPRLLMQLGPDGRRSGRFDFVLAG